MQSPSSLSTAVLSPSSQRQTEEHNLEEACNRLEQVANYYDKNYNEVSEILGLIADATSRTSAHCMDTLKERKEHWREWIERAKQAKVRSLDFATLKERQAYLRELETEQQDLVKEIIAGNQHTAELQNNRKNMERTRAKLDHEILGLRERKERELPSLDYLLKIMKSIAQVKLMPTADRSVIAGIIPHVSKNEIESFTFLRKDDVFSRVNEIWDRIDCP